MFILVIRYGDDEDKDKAEHTDYYEFESESERTEYITALKDFLQGTYAARDYVSFTCIDGEAETETFDLEVDYIKPGPNKRFNFNKQNS